jgi:hypothetical protein
MCGALAQVRWWMSMVGAVLSLLILTPEALAGCTGQARTDIKAAAASAGRLVAAGKAGAADSAAIVERARGRCATARFARAQAAATERMTPVAGQRTYVAGVRLIGVAYGAHVLWRHDAVSTVRDWQRLGRARRGVVRDRWVRTAFANKAGVVWSLDPTRRSVWAAVQISMADRLSRGDGADRALAVRTLQLLRSNARSRQAVAGPVLSALDQAVTATSTARRLRDGRAGRSVSLVRTLAARRLRSAETATWSRTDGQWSTLAQHRGLASRGERLLRGWPHPPTIRSVGSLRASLRAKPAVAFRVIPMHAFYPVPVDGVLDSRTVNLVVTKPASVTVNIYSAGGTIVRSLNYEGFPGAVVSGVWNGTDNAGQPVPSGSYPYGIVAVDRAGNRRTVPGLGSFVIARDTAPPKIAAASVNYVGGTSRRSLRVQWRASEPTSPRVAVVVTIRGNGVEKALRLSGSDLTANRTVRTRLNRGTYKTWIRITDGSGNAASRYAGSIVI